MMTEDRKGWCVECEKEGADPRHKGRAKLCYKHYMRAYRKTKDGAAASKRARDKYRNSPKGRLAKKRETSSIFRAVDDSARKEKVVNDWVEELPEKERSEWDRYVDHFRRETMQKIAGSNVAISLVPSDGFDPKFAMELGAMIMLDKPIIVVVHPGQRLPRKLKLIADTIIESDIDTEDGQRVLAHAITRFVESDS